jgi:hypothetical protein
MALERISTFNMFNGPGDWERRVDTQLFARESSVQSWKQNAIVCATFVAIYVLGTMVGITLGQ